ncbi:hypothetical protein N7490_005160 [Penicillium lividum]|nr:hypothetical protein N7490_005160 [Penicillium lividum]
MVRDIINYLEIINSKARSDRAPVLHTDERNSDARHDILDNQFCLLPGGLSSNTVDKVVLFYSEVLKSYCTGSEGRKYVKKVKKAGIQELRKLQVGGNSTISLNKQRIEAIQAAVRVVVNNHIKIPWFHHVLTEIGLIDLRISVCKNPLTIIPVDLHSIETVLEDFDFLRPTQHYIIPPPTSKIKFGTSESTHRMFFNLLERLYQGLPPMIAGMRKYYDSGLRDLENNLTEPTVFRREIRYELTEEIRRLGVAGPESIAKAFRSGLEDGDQTLDISAVMAEPEVPIPSPPDSIPKDLLRRPTIQQKELLRMLSFKWMGNLPLVTKEACPGIGRWLFEHSAYRKWLAQDNGMLGLRGKPGTGKSTAMKLIVESLQKSEGRTHVHLSFFFQAHSELEQTRSGMYRSLLCQLLEEIPSSGGDFWAWAEDKAQAHDRFGLEFSSMLSMKIVEDGARDVVADLRRITREVGRGAKGLSICFTGRHYPNIIVDNGLEIRVDQCNPSSISQFVDTS